MNALIRGDQLGHSLTYQGDVPLRWYLPEKPLDAAQALQLQNKNESVLCKLLELDDIHVDVNDESRENHADLARLEFKVDLALELLNQLYMREINLPDVCPLTLNTAYAEWMDARSPSVNKYIHLEVFLDTKYPHSLVFPATVQSVIEKSGRFKVTAKLDFSGELVNESLEKLIFRHHRRSIAVSHQG
ncbi:MAG: PilZ domain-containing protein [Gammaproteobacteria bacterium]|nr:PilZ domain-containing protein [Gammaproteobacteria bacterium]